MKKLIVLVCVKILSRFGLEVYTHCPECGDGFNISDEQSYEMMYHKDTEPCMRCAIKHSNDNAWASFAKAHYNEEGWDNNHNKAMWDAYIES